ncbi:unnamed protein product, partial [Ectocarpus fasciculatus]
MALLFPEQAPPSRGTWYLCDVENKGNTCMIIDEPECTADACETRYFQRTLKQVENKSRNIISGISHGLHANHAQGYSAKAAAVTRPPRYLREFQRELVEQLP